MTPVTILWYNRDKPKEEGHTLSRSPNRYSVKPYEMLHVIVSCCLTRAHMHSISHSMCVRQGMEIILQAAFSFVELTEGRPFLCLRQGRVLKQGRSKYEPTNSASAGTPTSGVIDSATRKSSAGGEMLTYSARLRGSGPSCRVVTMAGIEFKEIAARLPAAEFARHYLPMRGNRAKCPFNPDEQRYNVSFTRDGRAYCHACQRAKDVVQLAAATWGVSQIDAAKELNQVFNLGVMDSTPTEEEKQRRLQIREDAETKRREKARKWARACEDEQLADAVMLAFREEDVGKPEFEQTWKRFCAAKRTVEDLKFENGGV